MKWDEGIDNFIQLANHFGVRMIMVGGGGNFHGYQRHSADVDFWIDTSKENMVKLTSVFNKMGYEIDKFPDEVMQQKQNISIKFSPYDLDLELITRFSINKTFDEAYEESEEKVIKGQKLMKWKVLNYDDLITSKIKSGQPKDLLDVQQLKSARNDE